MGKRGFQGMPGSMNINKLMKEAQKMQKELQTSQAELASKTFEGTSAGGNIKISLSGNKEMLKVSIDKSVIDPDDPEMLEDLILVAYNDASKKIDEESSSMLDGFNIPGL